ncbi:MAG TPA: hypothetical protein VHO90_16465 [Bacteroidales bacterium]|nr:hypothetical protein [Bacteroidales bacterium]
MSKTNVKVTIPKSSPEELIDLGDKVDKKNTELGETSPVKTFNFVALKAALASAKAKREEAAELHQRAEKLNEEANLALGIGRIQNSKTPDTVLTIVTGIRDALLGFYRGKEQALNDWGYKVVSGGSSKKQTPSK